MSRLFTISSPSFLISLLIFLSSQSYGQINTPTPTIPFGTNTSYAYGILPSNRSNTHAQNAYNSWKTNFVRECGTQRRVLFDDGTTTVSEGIAYGMLLAAYAGDKALFDGLWEYYEAHSVNNLMHWKIGGCTGVTQTGPATDADIDAAWALLIAEHQWPTINTPYDYSAEATAIITSIGVREIQRVQDPGPYQTNNGAGWGFANTCRNPSYQAPAYYRQFAQHVPSQATLWNNAVTASYTLLNANVNTTTGLVSNWSDNTGTANNCNGPNEYGYDACRNPWRMSMDVIWNGITTTQTNFCNKIANYVQGVGAGNVKGPVSQAGANGQWHNPVFVSTYAAGIVGASSSYQTIMNSMYTETNNVTESGAASYFGMTLRCVSLFMMTGNFWKPTTSTPTTVTTAISSPANGTGFSEGDNISLTATASTTTGSITKVEFYQGSTKLGEDASSPYTFTWNNVPAGTYAITSVATNSGSQTGTSSVVTINVRKAIKRTSTTPTIDGTIDAVWSSHTASELKNTNQPTISSAADLTVNWRAMWDATNLYILVEVTDDAKFNDSGTETYKDDELEIYIDIGNNKPTTYGANDHQYTFRWNDATLVRETHAHSTAGITRATANPTSTTYVTEISIPWATMGGTPAVDQLVGFEVMMNDDDNGGERDGKKSWFAAADDTWSNPSLMGTVILKGLVTSNFSSLENYHIGEVDLYPNPFADETTIKINSSVTAPITLKVTDLNGKEIKTIENTWTNQDIKLGNDLPLGFYFVQITEGNKLQVVKLVKSR